MYVRVGAGSSTSSFGKISLRLNSDLTAKAEIKIKTGVPLTGSTYTHMSDESIELGHILQAGAVHSGGTYFTLPYGYQTANGSIYFQNTDSWDFSIFPTGWFIYF